MLDQVLIFLRGGAKGAQGVRAMTIGDSAEEVFRRTNREELQAFGRFMLWRHHKRFVITRKHFAAEDNPTCLT